MQSVLVLGAGQIGAILARTLEQRGLEVSIHCRRPTSLEVARAQIGVPPERCWHGDLLSDDQPFVSLAGKETLSPSRGSDQAASLLETSRRRLITLVEGCNVDAVADATNLATFAADRWRGGRGEASGGSLVQESMGLSAEVVQGRSIAVHELLYDDVIEKYLRVSTTGLGRRGLDLPFTHGDMSAGHLMSPALWLKLMFAGMEHQALWAISRTFPGRVKLVVPKSFVGFEDSGPTTMQSPGSTLATVGAGEDRTYTAEEVALLSSPLQMGAVTREEVAQVAADAILGIDSAKDLLSAMDGAAISPSLQGYLARAHMLKLMRSIEGADPAKGALGHRVSVGLFAIRTLTEQWPGTIARLEAQARVVDEIPKPVSERTLRAADFAGVRLRVHHEDSPEDGTDLCLCQDCSRDRLRSVADAVQRWLDRATKTDLQEFAALRVRKSWFEGDLLAILWEGRGASSLKF